MTSPDAAWREQFITEFGLDREPLETTLLHEGQPRQGPRLPEGVGPQREMTTQDRIPARYADALPAHPEVRAWMAELARMAIAGRHVVTSVSTGPSLLLLGATGRGKTHEAYGMIRGLSLLGVRSRWRVVTAADLYASMRPRHGIDSEAVFEEHAGATLLVLDDMGAAKDSEWTEEINYRLVNRRYERMLPTLWTSNLLPNDLANALGERVASRLAEMTSRVTLKGDDRRYGKDAA
jgi:DNA replication protein DnaC